jgi:hypothetical protein
MSVRIFLIFSGYGGFGDWIGTALFICWVMTMVIVKYDLRCFLFGGFYWGVANESKRENVG